MNCPHCNEPMDDDDGLLSAIEQEEVPVGTITVSMKDIVDSIQDDLIAEGLAADPRHIYLVIKLYSEYMDALAERYLGGMNDDGDD